MSSTLGRSPPPPPLPSPPPHAVIANSVSREAAAMADRRCRLPRAPLRRVWGYAIMSTHHGVRDPPPLGGRVSTDSGAGQEEKQVLAGEDTDRLAVLVHQQRVGGTQGVGRIVRVGTRADRG